MYTLLKSSLWRYFAKFVDTFILVLFGDGAIVASTLTGQPNFGFIMVSWGDTKYQGDTCYFQQNLKIPLKTYSIAKLK